MSLENSIDRLADAMDLLAISIQNMNMTSEPKEVESDASAAKRAEIIAKLKEMNVPFNPRQKTYTLEKMLEANTPRGTVLMDYSTESSATQVVEVVTEAPPIVIQTPLATPPEVVTIKEEPVVVAPVAEVKNTIKVPEVSGDAAKAMLLEYAKINGREKTVALLATFGATKISEVEAAGRLDEFVKAMGN